MLHIILLFIFFLLWQNCFFLEHFEVKCIKINTYKYIWIKKYQQIPNQQVAHTIGRKDTLLGIIKKKKMNGAVKYTTMPDGKIC